MANNKLTFAIALNLLTENFKKGKNNVVNGFKSMQVKLLAFVSALGFGSIGLSNFVSKLISVAKETSRVTTALKNVSKGTAGYIANQKFLNKVAADYKIEINSLTGNFAKFTAAATTGGMALKDQQKIFKSVSKSIAAFSLSSDEANSVFLALSQMMSKGKIASQELRLQMGEKLPIAIQAMANAMGVSVAELDKMLSKGELMANEVLPKFADQLEKMTPKIDTDNLQASLTDLENAFGTLTDNLGVERKYKKIIDGVASIITAGANNIKGILQAIVLGIVFFSVNGITKISKRFKEALLERATGAEKLSNQLQSLEARRTLEFKKLEELRANYAYATGNARLKLQQQIAVQEGKFGKLVVEASKKELALEEAKQQKKLGLWKNFSRGSIGIINKLGATIKSLWNTFAPAIIITGLIAIFNYFKNINKEAKRLKNTFSDYKKEAENSTSTSEITQLQTLQGLYNDANKSIKEKKGYKDEIVKLLGVEIGKEQDLNDVIRERIKLLETQAKVEFYTQKKIEAEDQFKTASKKLDLGGLEEKEIESIMMGYFKYIDSGYKDTKSLSKATGDYSKYLKNRGQYYSKDTDELIKSIAPSYAIMNDSQKMLEELTSDIIQSTKKGTGGSGGGNKDSNLSQLQIKYAKALQELGIKLEEGIITQDDYNKSFDDLVQSSLIEAKLTNDGAVLKSNYFKVLKQQMANPLFDEQGAEIRKIQNDYNDELTKVTNLKKNGIITEEEQNKALIELKEKTINQIASMSDLTDAQKEFIKTLQGERDNIKNLTLPNTYKAEERDRSFDYKKSDLDIYSEELEIAKRNYATLKDLASENLQAFEAELTAAMGNVKSLEEAVKLAELTADVEALNKEIAHGSYDAAKSIMGGADGMISSIERINDAFSNPDASGWEQIMSIWSAMTSTIDSFLQIIDLIQRLSEVTEMLSTAQQAQTAIETSMVPQKIANTQTEAAAEVAASQIKTNAAMGETAAKSTAAYAKFPFVGVGLAAAAIAAMFALIPKFKDGGIVTGGATSGDKILARVNAGEMILNQGQQSNLFKMLNSQSSVSNQSLNIGGRVRGSDIYLALKNYMKSSGKRL